MAVSLDTRKAHSSHRYGDLTIILTWMNDKRVMVILPSFRAKAPWFIIQEEVAFEWSDQDAGNLRFLPDRAHRACEVLGIEPNRTNCFRIISMVNDRLQDLVRMPSKQPPEKIAGSFGAMTLKADGQVMHQEDIRLDAEEGAMYG